MAILTSVPLFAYDYILATWIGSFIDFATSEVGFIGGIHVAFVVGSIREHTEALIQMLVVGPEIPYSSYDPLYDLINSNFDYFLSYMGYIFDKLMRALQDPREAQKYINLDPRKAKLADRIVGSILKTINGLDKVSGQLARFSLKAAKSAFIAFAASSFFTAEPGQCTLLYKEDNVWNVGREPISLPKLDPIPKGRQQLFVPVAPP